MSDYFASRTIMGEPASGASFNVLCWGIVQIAPCPVSVYNEHDSRKNTMKEMKTHQNPSVARSVVQVKSPSVVKIIRGNAVSSVWLASMPHRLDGRPCRPPWSRIIPSPPLEGTVLSPLSRTTFIVVLFLFLPTGLYLSFLCALGLLSIGRLDVLFGSSVHRCWPSLSCWSLESIVMVALVLLLGMGGCIWLAWARGRLIVVVGVLLMLGRLSVGMLRPTKC
jgi:hypothetical protein